MAADAESRRLAECREQGMQWRKWGPYLSERQWGTVREDYSDNGDAWSYFSHDQARSRAYGWGEDGLAGFSDDGGYLCLALALWNGVDPILKERLFGLTNAEGNHGEDVKEYYFYLDATPTHSYQRWLYKYPQRPFPYEDLVRVNRTRSRHEPEYELLDTGVFDDDRYFDVVVEYAKAGPEDVLMRVTAVNRGPDAAPLHVLPTFWFRDVWTGAPNEPRPVLRRAGGSDGAAVVAASHRNLGERWLACAGTPAMLFTENESNQERLFGKPNRTPYVKDAFHRVLIAGEAAAANPAGSGTKAAAHYRLDVPGGGSATLRVRLADVALGAAAVSAEAFDAIVKKRRDEADAFYAAVMPANLNDDKRLVMRQALAGMLWSKQHYFFDLDAWLAGHGAGPYDQGSSNCRNIQWFHMVNDDVISMPDKWEYPWYAAWDLAFHTLPLALVDLDFAKRQLVMMLRDVYMHPSGQLPAYEWNFGDVNPPVHAWATLSLYQLEEVRDGAGDREFLREAFHGLANNFTWWVNRKDPTGRNAFEGGFLGLDNIGVFDRSRPLPTGGRLEQADGTAWMVFFSQCMFEIALELARYDPVYEKEALRYLQHFFWIAAAMDRLGVRKDEMWDEEDGFFYDVLRLSDADAMRLKVRSMVGLLPLCAVAIIEADAMTRFPWLAEAARRFLRQHSELVLNIASPTAQGVSGRRLLSPLGEAKLRRVLSRLLDEREFLSPHGIRALSRWHLDHPFVFNVHGEEYRVDYEPAESTTGLFGGNSNWRGPVWFPVNALVVRALLQYYRYYGDAFTVECPTGSGRQMTLFEVAHEIGRRLSSTFLRDGEGRRPVFGGAEKFQKDPRWRDCLLFYEYFHGDNGAGIGASHQTGWTGLVASVLYYFGRMQAGDALKGPALVGQEADLA
jgi:Mannosylglycerate hydrolase MGH1-like glycoside hydrolase domain